MLYVYANLQINPQQLAENFQKNGSYIPGIRPGNETEAVVANAPDIVQAGRKAYAAAANINFKEAYHRSDITKDLLKYL